MSPKSSLTIYAIGVLGALLICSITALVGYQLGIDEGLFIKTNTNAPVAAQTDAAGSPEIKTQSSAAEQAPAQQPVAAQPVVVAPELEPQSDLGRKELERELLKSDESLAIMAAENRKLAQEIQRLDADLVRERNSRVELETLVDGLKHQLNIDKTAYADLKVSLTESSKDMTDLRDELNFYRNILSPDESGTGVRVDLFSIVAVDPPGRYQYEFTLIQMQPHDNPMIGNLNVEIEGVEAGIRRIVDVTIFGDELKKQLSFKYYQKVHGAFDIPAAFSPTGVTVSFQSDNNNTVAVSQSYPWPEAVGDAIAN